MKRADVILEFSIVFDDESEEDLTDKEIIDMVYNDPIHLLKFSDDVAVADVDVVDE